MKFVYRNKVVLLSPAKSLQNTNHFSNFRQGNTIDQSISNIFTLTCYLCKVCNPLTCLSSSTSRSWVIDSSATYHMIGKSHICPLSLYHFCSLLSLWLLEVFMMLVGLVIYMSPLFILVLYMPKFHYNSMSVCQISKSFNCSETYFFDQCIFQ